MIFQFTWGKVLSGEKTQTRRIVKPEHTQARIALGTALEFMPVGHGWGDIVAVRLNGRDVYALGKDYAVQPARTKAAVARIRIIDIRREDVREISAKDVTAEGFDTASDFFITWCKMHDKGQMLPIIPDYFTGAIVWQGVRSALQQRPDKFYQAWALTFEVVR